MKKLFILSLLFGMLYSCSNEVHKSNEAIGTDGKSYDVIVIDSCEYITWCSRIAHKGNCRFCEERNKNKQCQQYQN